MAVGCPLVVVAKLFDFFAGHIHQSRNPILPEFFFDDVSVFPNVASERASSDFSKLEVLDFDLVISYIKFVRGLEFLALSTTLCRD